jgi:hypothetical protein
MVEVPGNTCNEYDDIFIICTSRTIKNGGFTTLIMTNPAVKTKSPIFLPTEEKIVLQKWWRCREIIPLNITIFALFGRLEGHETSVL